MAKSEFHHESKQADQVESCFTLKLLEFEKSNSTYLKNKNIQLSDLYYTAKSQYFIKYEFRPLFEKQDDLFQKEAELFFSLALKGCLDKYSE